ncbi:---NA--- [Podarcis lilfordi]|uniref:---NA n=1 Tax=Podarcis lilfordi TaxID=74358 RepID=A0AA35K631_9SAUR|nr:---NA--- [Podarcis lilfordi]
MKVFWVIPLFLLRTLLTSPGLSALRDLDEISCLYIKNTDCQKHCPLYALNLGSCSEGKMCCKSLINHMISCKINGAHCLVWHCLDNYKKIGVCSRGSPCCLRQY